MFWERSKEWYSQKLIEIINNISIEVSIFKIEDGYKIYNVEIPPYFKVKPPDWRDLAYDHAKVKNLIRNCVTDNCNHFIFEPTNENNLNRVRSYLYTPLTDLSSVIDLISIECTTNKESTNHFTVTVKFEHKNGEQNECVIDV